MNGIRHFQSPQDPFLEREFIEMLKKYIDVVSTDNIPTINGKTFYWSTKKYPNIKNQYLLNENIKNPKKFFYIKKPCSYQETFQNYHKHFRNQLRKAQKNNLIFEIMAEPDKMIIKQCYQIYDQNMANIKTFSLDYDFFKSFTKLSYTYILLIKLGNDIVSFGLTLGNLLFIQSSTDKGKHLCANNLLYDRLFNTFENKPVFIGIASKNHDGLTRFKQQAGLTPIPAKATFFDFTHYMPRFFRHNRIAGYFIRKVNKKRILKYILPY